MIFLREKIFNIVSFHELSFEDLIESHCLCAIIKDDVNPHFQVYGMATYYV